MMNSSERQMLNSTLFDKQEFNQRTPVFVNYRFIGNARCFMYTMLSGF